MISISLYSTWQIYEIKEFPLQWNQSKLNSLKTPNISQLINIQPDGVCVKGYFLSLNSIVFENYLSLKKTLLTNMFLYKWSDKSRVNTLVSHRWDMRLIPDDGM